MTQERTIKILSVDDEQDMELLLSQFFRRQIRKGEYQFRYAHNGSEALDILSQEPDTDIVLSDINMPEMDGLTMLSRLNEMQNPALKCIMISAYGDMGNIRQAMNNGAFDFATKPIDMDDLAVTIDKAIEQIEYIRHAQQEHTQLESLKTDLAVAGEIQQAILPRTFPPFPEFQDALDLAALMTPAKDVGGDFYDFFRIDAGRIGMVIADVSGKGVPAAIFMAVSRTLIRTIAQQGGGAAETLTAANKLLCAESADNMFVTVFYAVYHVNTGEIDYANGGHNSPYLIRANGKVERMPVSPNPIMAIVDDLDFVGGHEVLQPGDTILMYTDGVNEAYNPQAGEYGEERMEQLMESMPQFTCRELIEKQLEDVRRFAAAEPQSDDITLMAIKRV